MRTIPIRSRLIETISFRETDGLLWIKFRNGKERLFNGVPLETAEQLGKVASPGQYYLDHIRTSYARARG